ncbi:MAG TPA: histidine kinase, partial [Candidatus Kryptobacter bacterium]|nr:histidine kinase [Candidatus Kryptobacter bacterium]
KDVVGKRFEDFLPPESGKIFRTAFEKARQKGIAEYIEYVGTGDRGVLKYYDSYIVPVIKRGRLEHVLVLARDITERKRADEEIKRKTEDLSLLNALHSAANRGASLRDIIALVAEGTKRIFSTKGATIYFPDKDGESLIMQNITASTDQVQWIEQLTGMNITVPEVRIVMGEGSIYRRIVRGGKPTLTNDPAVIQKMMAEFTQNPNFKKLIPAVFDFVEPSSVITAPFIADGELIGMMDISRKLPFTETDLQRIEVIAEDLSAILQRKRAEEALSVAKERLAKLSHRLLEAQETERRNIARELHDEIGQILTATKIDLQVARRNPLPEHLALRLDENIKMLDTCLQRVRDLSLDLRPAVLDDLGLEAALSWQLERFRQRAGFDGRITTGNIPKRLKPELETACFRIAQEAMTNITKHASAKSVKIDVAVSGDELIMRIEDDGRGFDAARALTDAVRGKSFGLLGMQERVALLGGQLDINSAKGEGTVVAVRLPLRPLVPNDQEGAGENV